MKHQPFLVRKRWFEVSCSGRDSDSNPARLIWAVATAALAVVSAACGNSRTADAPEAWAVGDYGILIVDDEDRSGTIFHSDDGGSTWTVNSTGYRPLHGVDFVTRELGWAVGGGEIVNTTNGGSSWSTQRSNIQLPPDRPHVFGLRDVAFIDRARGVAVGGYVGQAGTFRNRPLILETSDGGGVWREAEISSEGEPPEASVLAVCLSRGGAGVAVSGSIITSGSFVTEDGGKHWRNTSAAIIGYAVACAGERDLWVLGAPSSALQVMHSPDGGLTWQERTGDLATVFEGHAGALTFLDASRGWIAGQNLEGNPSAYRTTDGGLHWQRQGLPTDGGAVASLAFITEVAGIGVGIRVGSSAELALASYFTQDGGSTWRASSVPSDRGQFRDLSIVLK